MSCYLYVMAHLEDDALRAPCKIGISAAPYGRMLGIQTGNPRPLSLAFVLHAQDRSIASKTESDIHRLFARRRLCGEWFDVDPAEAIHAICLAVVRGEDQQQVALAGVRQAAEFVGVPIHQ